MAQMYTIQVHAILLSDDDGKRANTVTKEKFAEALEKVTEIFKPADLRFAFDPDNDWKPRKSTELNSLHNGGNKWWEAGNKVAVSGGVNMYWNRRDKSRRGELAVGAGGRRETMP
ncbi:MAG: hypothetical protein ACREXW_15925 [Gammaproteobacteria bacterium]